MFNFSAFIDIYPAYVDAIDTSRNHVDVYRKYRHVAVTQIESTVKPNGVTDYVGWGPQLESVAFVCVHLLILTIPASLFGNTHIGATSFNDDIDN
jgi:hypothetical protein